MKTREVAQMCGVTERTVSGNARKAGVVLENGKSHNWTEEEVKRLQLVLMANAQNNNVNASDVVKETSKIVFELGISRLVIDEIRTLAHNKNTYLLYRRK